MMQAYFGELTELTERARRWSGSFRAAVAVGRERGNHSFVFRSSTGNPSARRCKCM